MKFKKAYPEWLVEKQAPDGVELSVEEKLELRPMPLIAMVSSVGSNDEKDMYNYLGGIKNGQRSDALDAAFKQEKSNFRIAIVVDMWITGFDVPCLTYLYNDKPLKKHMLIQTISRVNRKYPGKEYGLIVDYIGIRDNMELLTKCQITVSQEKIADNHNHRPCRWYAQAPLGPSTSRAYRLIEFLSLA